MSSPNMPTVKSGYRCLDDAELLNKYGNPYRFDETSFDPRDFLGLSRNTEAIPNGFCVYFPEDFRKYFNISDNLSILVACDYRLVLALDRDSYIAEITREAAATRNLKIYQDRLIFRYGLKGKTIAPLVRYFANLPSPRRDRDHRLQLGITTLRWVYDPQCQNPGHKEADNKKFDLVKGMKINGNLIFPSAAMGCDCMSRSVIPGFRD